MSPNDSHKYLVKICIYHLLLTREAVSIMYSELKLKRVLALLTRLIIITSHYMG